MRYAGSYALISPTIVDSDTSTVTRNGSQSPSERSALHAAWSRMLDAEVTNSVRWKMASISSSMNKRTGSKGLVVLSEDEVTRTIVPSSASRLEPSLVLTMAGPLENKLVLVKAAWYVLPESNTAGPCSEIPMTSWLWISPPTSPPPKEQKMGLSWPRVWATESWTVIAPPSATNAQVLVDISDE